MSNLPVLPKPGWPANAADSDESSCKLAGEFFATWMTTPDQIKALTYRGPGLDVTAGYLRALFGGAEGFSDGQLLWWFADTQKGAEMDDPAYMSHQQFMESIIQPAVTSCSGSVCKALGWTGNSDLAGIGVLTSYYIEAVLATLFMIGLLIKGSKGVFRSTVPDLAVGVFVFSFAVMAASLNAILEAQDDPASVTTYDVTTGVLVTVFSVCPATLLYCLNERFLSSDDSKSQSGRRRIKYMLRAALFALWIFMLVVVNLGLQSDPSKEALEAGTIGHPFEVYCQVIGTAPLQAVRIFAVVSAGLGAIWVLYLVWYRMRHRDSNIKKNRWPVIISLLACIAMWLFLVSFTVLRARIIDVAGESDKSNEWSFGQIIALAAWVPVLLNFFYTLFFRSDKD